MPNLHSLKHLITELIRNHLDNVLDFGPMGCQTGFYLSVTNNDSYKEVEEALAKTLEDVLVATEVPACNEVQCGWAASHSLEGSQMEAKKFGCILNPGHGKIPAPDFNFYIQKDKYPI